MAKGLGDWARQRTEVLFEKTAFGENAVNQKNYNDYFYYVKEIKIPEKSCQAQWACYNSYSYLFMDNPYPS